MKRSKTIILFLFLIVSCQEKKVVTQTCVYETDSVTADERYTTGFYSSKKFKEIAAKNDFEMLFGDADTLHIVGSFKKKKKYKPQIGDSPQLFFGNLFITATEEFERFAIVEHSSDLAADDCAEYVFEENKIIKINNCR
jgi:hypothetical protein